MCLLISRRRRFIKQLLTVMREFALNVMALEWLTHMAMEGLSFHAENALVVTNLKMKRGND